MHTRWRRFLPLIIVAGLSAVFLVTLQQNQGKTAASKAVDIPFPAATLASLADDHSDPLELPLPKGKVWVLNVFASWCASCIMEHPVLKAWKSSDAGKSVPLVGMTWRDQPSATRAWLEKMGNVYDHLGSDAHGETAINLGLTGVPETYVIDSNGHIAGVLRGPVTEQERTRWLEPLIKSLEDTDASR